MLVPRNIKLEIVQILDQTAGLSDFSTDYPEDWTVFPYAVYRTATRSHYVNNRKEEAQTEWTAVIEVYGKKNVSNIANSITANMRALGFRVEMRDSNVIGLKRIVLTCTGIVDNVTNLIYQ